METHDLHPTASTRRIWWSRLLPQDRRQWLLLQFLVAYCYNIVVVVVIVNAGGGSGDDVVVPHLLCAICPRTT